MMFYDVLCCFVMFYDVLCLKSTLGFLLSERTSGVFTVIFLHFKDKRNDLNEVKNMHKKCKKGYFHFSSKKSSCENYRLSSSLFIPAGM